MLSTPSAAVRIGIAGGMLFFLHASVPGSRAYRLIWPMVTGAVAFQIASSDATYHRVKRGLSGALVAGMVVGAIGFLGPTVTLLVFSRSALNQVAETLGAGGPSLAVASAELGLALIALIAVALSLIGGALMIPFTSARTSQRAQPHPQTFSHSSNYPSAVLKPAASLCCA